MESDWVAVGLIDLAVAGVVDFRESRPADPAWHRRLFMLLKGLRREQQFKMADARYRFYLTQYARADEGNADRAFKHTTEAYHDLLGVVTPWQGRTYEERMQRVLRSDRQDYIDAFGVDPSDPAFKRWEADQIAAAVTETKRAAQILTPEEQLQNRLRAGIFKRKGH